MLYQGLLAPAESPATLRDIKKALLTYDKVILIDPNDRDLMPTALMQCAIMPGMPSTFGVSGPPVRAMGKRISYDETFEKQIEELKPAIKQGTIEVKAVFQPEPVRQGFNGVYFGPPPRNDYPLDESIVYNIYRSLSSDISLIQNAIELDKHSLINELKINNNLALKGTADSEVRINSINNEPGQRLPFLNNPNFSETINAQLTLIARARIAMLIKYSGYCQNKEIIPVFDFKSYGAVFSHILRNSQKTISEIEDDKDWARRNRALQLCHEEFIDNDILDSMSIQSVMKLRTKVWGENAEKRESLFRDIEKIALNCDSDELFGAKALPLIQGYRAASSELVSERKAFKFSIKCDLGKALIPLAPALGGMAGQISTGWSFGMTLLTAVPWALDFFKEHKQQLNKMKAMEIDMQRSYCFGIHNFYTRLK
jgi:hypothetical protein